jgi:hypothetical protein
MRSIVVVCLGLTLFGMGSPQAAETNKEPAAKKPVTDAAKPPVGVKPVPPNGIVFPKGMVPPNGPPAGIMPPNGFPQGGPPQGFPVPPMMPPNAPQAPPNGFPMNPPKWAAPNMARGGLELPKGLVPALIASLKDTDKDVRQFAAGALARVGQEAVEPLLDLLKGNDKAQRANAAYVLGLIGTPAQEEGLPVLIKALKDSDRLVRIRAAFAIERLLANAERGNPMMMAAAMANAYKPMGQAQKPKVPLPSDPGTVAPSEKEPAVRKLDSKVDDKKERNKKEKTD